MRVLIAPNAFKDSLDARAAADAIREGLERSRLAAGYFSFPIADGGDGTGSLLTERLGGTRVEVPAQDPLGRTIGAAYGIAPRFGAPTALLHQAAPGPIALIDMATASGLSLLQPGERDPLHVTSQGTGQLLRSALSAGARQVLLGVGGSATVDGGAGILHALGARLLDAAGHELSPNPLGLLQLDRIDLTGLYPPVRDTRMLILCDVDNPLLGPSGTAAVFGPQKGADAGTVALLEKALTRWCEVISRMGVDRRPGAAGAGADTAALSLGALPHGGAAGGVAAGLFAVLGATLVNGADGFLDLTRFDDALERADLVLTGEGSLDAQTLRGKGPYAIARRALTRDIPVIGLAGSIPTADEPRLRDFFDALFNINHAPSSLDQALRDTRANLTRTALAIGDLLALRS
ncbi:glycerate kinase [Dinghuibacter silviterrae]|uniref:Glycerate kinase n=1 Tax=Dinghuibacter silviterrae TaxID=1539049 RepID=A0A4V3GKI7_9BACT|nr:glycerate kinase [Dinghuibacter silviterrae]TDW95812.1 glycerate kinase [Dinghuibacter silviterrae]